MPLFKKDDNKWKDKAKQKSIENKKLKKQLKEAMKSRDQWKTSAKHFKSYTLWLKDELKKN